MKSMISMGELITEAHDGRDCGSPFLVAYKMKNTPQHTQIKH